MCASLERTPVKERLNPLYDGIGDYVALKVNKSDLTGNLYNCVYETQIDVVNCGPLVKPLSNNFASEKGSVLGGGAAGNEWALYLRCIPSNF